MSSRVGFFGLAVALCGVGLFTAGCGGSSGTSCGTFEPCGGSLNATWVKADTCGKLTDPGCALATYKIKKDTAQSITFDASGNYTGTTGDGEVSETVPQSCLSSTCASLASSTRTCTTSGSNCTCDTVVAASSASGTYTTNGSTVTTIENGASETYNYCVTGDELRIQTPGNSDFTVYKAVGN